ncbi:MAG: CoA ester lyase [Alphaproteobacteria bacterium]|nr:CoA ester lyase [Alphaproteobacteria bacterium]
MDPLRCFLFVPADSERKYQKASGTAADALILDLEDSVNQDNLPQARQMAHDYLLQSRDKPRPQSLWVRINPLDTDLSLVDLAAVMGGSPDGIILPKTFSAAEAIKLDHMLSALEARENIQVGRTKILVVATETARSLFTMDSFVSASDRIYGMTWGAEDLSAALGAFTNQMEDSGYEDVYRLARSLCLAACKAAETEPVDSVYPNFRDLDGLFKEALQGRKTGFTGKVAIHPDQVDVINSAFAPTEAEIAFAHRVIDAFKDKGGSGTVGMDGKMLDMPHLKQARTVLAMAERNNA